MRPHAAICVSIGICLSLATSCQGPRTPLGPVPTAKLTDGTYPGIGKSGPVKVVAEVQFADGRIAGIVLAKHRTWKGRAAEKGVPERILQTQSTKVDAVTGATYSSEAIMRAVQQAVEHAGQY
ncbi:MAG: FMN-binding protein [Victivallales bacterium]|nr:FMN-binding protein [Victivallales bacterium]